MGKHFIAINLNDYHDPSKKWQGGTVTTVEIRVIGGKNLFTAREHAHSIDPKTAWYVFPMGTYRNMVYAEVKEK